MVAVLAALALSACDPTETNPTTAAAVGLVKVFDSGDGSKVWRGCDGTTAVYVLRESGAAKSIFVVKDGCAK